MPLYVSIYTIEGGRNTLAGVISLGQSGLTAEPRPGNEALINSILKESIQDPKTHQEVNPSINPERWIRCLCFNFRSAYLNASGASLIKPGITIPGAPASTPPGPPGPGPPGPSEPSNPSPPPTPS